MTLCNLVQDYTLKIYRILDRRFSRKSPIDIFDYLSKAKTVLVCLPIKAKDFSIAQEYFNKLGNAFPNAAFTFLIREEQVLINSTDNPHQVIQLPKQQSFFGFPPAELRKRIKKQKFDVVVDFSVNFDFATTLLCRASKSKLRICLSNPKRDPFFNFLVRTDPRLPLERHFEILIQYLKGGSTTVLNSKPL